MPLWKFVQEGTTTTELEDAAFELSAYYQALDDLTAWLRAHDGQEFDDIAGYLVAWATAFDDQGAYLEAQNAFTENLFAWLSAVPEDREDFIGLLAALGTDYSDSKCDFIVAASIFESLSAYLATTDGSVLADLASYMTATDGSVLADNTMWLSAITPPPIFKSIVAQRLSPVLTEVT
jgi:hypothetical protein